MPRTTASLAHAKVIGQRIRAARNTLGLTQEEVGSRLGASGSYIAGVEAGRRLGRTRRIGRVTLSLDSDLASYMTGSSIRRRLLPR